MQLVTYLRKTALALGCPLCVHERLTEHLYEDHICWIARCLSCGTWMIVLNRHGEPTSEELTHLNAVSKRHFPDKVWRGIRHQIPDHRTSFLQSKIV